MAPIGTKNLYNYRVKIELFGSWPPPWEIGGQFRFAKLSMTEEGVLQKAIYYPE